MATVLLVEDDPVSGRVWIWLCAVSAMVCILPRPGEAALHGVRDATVDVVAPDVMLPGVDGFEVCRRRSVHITAQTIGGS
jgi:DNA-binding response OmpR family regulator